MVGAMVAVPAVATTRPEGPRSPEMPLLMALAMATQRALPLPAMLSNTPGTWPGRWIVTLVVLAADPAAMVMVSEFAPEPVYFDVMVTPLA